MKGSYCNDRCSITHAAFVSVLAHVCLFLSFNFIIKPKKAQKSFLYAQIYLRAVPRPDSDLTNRPDSKNKTPTKKTKAFTFRKNIQEAPVPLLSISPEPHHVEDTSPTNTGIITRSMPILLNKAQVKVNYPPKARKEKREGSVKLLLTINEIGHVVQAEVIDYPSLDLKQAALVLAHKLLFLPATDKNGRARIARIEHEVIFLLKDFYAS